MERSRVLKAGMSAREALAIVGAQIRAVSKEYAQNQAEWLLLDVLGIRRAELFSNGKIILDRDQAEKLEKFTTRRLQNEPVQYIVGMTDFRTLRLTIDHRALIPRPETEGLVQIGLNDIRYRQYPRVLDIGTGCGAIGLSILDEHPTAHITAVDSSRDALDLAYENAAQLGFSERMNLIHTDFLTDEWLTLLESPYDLVISNPPYISQKEYWELPPDIRLYEPSAALLAGDEGLQFIKRLAYTVHLMLKRDCYFICEIGERQARKTLDIFQHTGWNAFVRNDLNGKPRYLIASRA